MAAGQQGDRRCYERLLREIIPVLYRFVRSRWPAAQACEIDEVVQATLVSLHAARHTYSPGRPFLPWLLGVARHRLLDELRRHGRRRDREAGLDPFDETIPAPASNTAQDAAVDAAIAAADLRGIVELLPQRQRTAVELLKLREMSLKEASLASGMSVAALKVASHRALKSLRIMLGGAG